MKKNILDIVARAKTGKGAARSVRRSGMVPGIIYGGNDKEIPFSIDPRSITQQLRLGNFFSKIYVLKMDGEEIGRVLAKDLQLHPVTDQPWHIDFMRISPKMQITLTVPIRFIGEDICPGIKEGGLLNIVRHGLEVMCSADNILEEIVCDLAQLRIGDAIRVSQLKLPDFVIPIGHDRDLTIATVIHSHIHDGDQKEDVSSSS